MYYEEGNRSISLCFPKFQLPVFPRKQDGGHRDGDGIRDRLREEHGHHLVFKEAGQDEDQRDQQDQFSQACKKQTDLCLSECHKTLLAAYTPGKQETAREDFNNSRNYV